MIFKIKYETSSEITNKLRVIKKNIFWSRLLKSIFNLQRIFTQIFK